MQPLTCNPKTQPETKARLQFNKDTVPSAHFFPVCCAERLHSRARIDFRAAEPTFPQMAKTAERRMAWLSGQNATFRKKTCIWKRQPRPKRKDPSFPRETRSWNIGEASKRSRPRQIGAGWKASRRLNRSKSARHCSMPRNPTGAISFDAGLTLTPTWREPIRSGSARSVALHRTRRKLPYAMGSSKVPIICLTARMAPVAARESENPPNPTTG